MPDQNPLPTPGEVVPETLHGTPLSAPDATQPGQLPFSPPNTDTQQPAFQEPQQVIQPPSQPEIPQSPEPFYKNKIFIIEAGVLVFLILLILGINRFLNHAPPGATVMSQKQYQADVNYTPEPLSSISPMATYIPATSQPEQVCNSPLAPTGAGPVSKCNYRDTKASIADAQAVMGRIYSTFGVTQIPSSLNFHQEVYKGIAIKWTDNQPISGTAMSWIKSAIDTMPTYFYVDHPVTAIISATPDDLQTKGVAPEYLGAIAYASGLNIFLTKDLAAGSSTEYVVDEPTTFHALFHEWVHIIQMYDTLQTFTEASSFNPRQRQCGNSNRSFNQKLCYCCRLGFSG